MARWTGGVGRAGEGKGRGVAAGAGVATAQSAP